MDIKEILKSEGLEHLEEFSGKMFNVGLKIADELSKKHAIAVVLWAALKPLAKAEGEKFIDKIDGKEG